MLHLGQGDVSIYLSPVRPSLGTTGFHQDLQSSGGVVGLLRIKGVRCVIYLDDLLIMAADRNQAILQCAAATRLFVRIIRVSRELPKVTDRANSKGDLLWARAEPSWLEANRVTGDSKLMRQTWVSAREIAWFVGKLSAMMLEIHPAPLHYRGLQHLKHQALQDYNSQIRMSSAAKEDLQWWLHSVSMWNERNLQETSPQLETETDAS